MESKQFRLGNYVHIKSHKQDYEIILLDADRELMVEPIPLTEKLLVDYLGYEPSAFTGLYYDKEGIIDIKVSWDNKFTVFYKNFEIREVEFVHDLQNLAFALTKEELKINE